MYVYTRQYGFDCRGEKYLNSTMEMWRENMDLERQNCEENGQMWMYDRRHVYDNGM